MSMRGCWVYESAVRCGMSVCVRGCVCEGVCECVREL